MIRKTGAIGLLMLLLPSLLAGCGTGASVGSDPDFIKAKKILEYQASKYDNLEATGVMKDGIREIHLTARQFSFTPDLIIVNKGEKIRLIVESLDTPHGFEIEGYMIPGWSIDQKIRKGQPAVIEFTADEKGVWKFICTVYCGFGHSTMRGTFVIR